MKFVMVCMPRPAVGCGGVVVSALDFRSEGRWFEAQSLPSCLFFFQTRNFTLHCLSPPRCINGYQQSSSSNLLASHPGGGGVPILSVASCYRNVFFSFYVCQQRTAGKKSCHLITWYWKLYQSIMRNASHLGGLSLCRIEVSWAVNVSGGH